MSEIARNRALLASIAAVAVIIGLLFLGGMPGTEPTGSPAGPATSSGVPEEESSQTEEFAIRDYSDYGQGAAADLPSSDWLGLLAGMVVKLAFVIALIYLVILVLKRYLYRVRPATAQRKIVSILGTTNLAPNRTVYVLEVGRKVLVVGATAGQMSTLTEVTDPEGIEEVRLLSAENPQIDQFGPLLSAFGRRLGDQDRPAFDAQLVTSLQAKVREGRDFVQSRIIGNKQPPGQD